MFNRHAINSAILSLAPAHVARALAPASFSDLMRAHDAPLPVWDGASDQTIFRDARVNHAFRAWHDATHRAGHFDFTLAGEIATAKAQKVALGLRYPSAPAWAYRLIDAEVAGQAEYFAAHGRFPMDQEQFTLEAIGQ